MVVAPSDGRSLIFEGSDSPRLDKFLSTLPEVLSRAMAQKMISSGAVSVNGGAVLQNRHPLSCGDRVEFSVPEAPETGLEAVEHPLEVHYEDEHLLVVHKEEGVVVHPSAGHANDTLVNFLLAHTRIEAESGSERPGIVHRLDKDTSGLLVVAKTESALRKLAEDFAEHSILRVYDALVVGRVRAAVGKIEKNIGRSATDRKKQAVRRDGRRAVTRWKKVETRKGFTRLKCTLETGRTHQIRVHLSSVGHPVAGDPLYGGKGVFFKNPEDRKQFNEMGLGLHAAKLGFRHPFSGEWMEFEKECPERIGAFVERLGPPEDVAKGRI